MSVVHCPSSVDACNFLPSAGEGDKSGNAGSSSAVESRIYLSEAGGSTPSCQHTFFKLKEYKMASIEAKKETRKARIKRLDKERKAIAKRKILIFKMRAKKHTYESIAAVAGISISRVGQIIKKG